MRTAEAHGVAVAVEKVQSDLISLRRDLHRHPELGFAEERTASLVAERMRSLGLSVRTGVGGTGVLADLAGELPGPVLLIRADMDGLPVTEATGLEFASLNPGTMHACGHDAHVAALVGAASVLSEMRAAIAGTVRFCFQPAEELLAGAPRMIDDGAMDGVDRVLGAHLLAMAPFGQVIAVPGPFLAGADFFELRIVGQAGHGGMPHLSIDPVYAAAQVVSALQSIVARETRPGERLVLSITAIQGGQAANVTVEEVRLLGNLRWFSQDERQRALERIQVIARGVCESLRARAEFTVETSAPVTINSLEETSVVERAARDTGWATVVNPGPITASDDFAYLLDGVPGTYFGVGAGGPGAAPHHHQRFDIDERAIGLMSELFVRATLAFLAAET
jgi:amidohydrolase